MATKLGAVAKCDYSELLYGCSRRLVGNKVVVSFRGFVPRSYIGFFLVIFVAFQDI